MAKAQRGMFKKIDPTRLGLPGADNGQPRRELRLDDDLVKNLRNTARVLGHPLCLRPFRDVSDVATESDLVPFSVNDDALGIELSLYPILIFVVLFLASSVIGMRISRFPFVNVALA